MTEEEISLKWELYGENKIIIGTSIFTIKELQDRVLNLIKKQQEEIERNKRLFSVQEKRKWQLLQRKDKEIEKKDKYINELKGRLGYTIKLI